MNLSDFAREIDRLKVVYGERNYPGPRVEILFQKFGHLPEGWLVSVVDNFIGTHRQAPLVPEFEEEARRYRERSFAPQARVGGGGVARMADVIPIAPRPEQAGERREFVDFCQRALADKRSGKITREQFFDEVMPMVDSTAAVLNPGECRWCQNGGVVISRVKPVGTFRCQCRHGDKVPEVWFGPERDGKREEIKIPRWTPGSWE